MRTPLPAVVLAVLTLAPALAQAQPWRRPLNQASDALRDAGARARRAPPACSQAITDELDDARERIAPLLRSGERREARRLQADLSRVASAAAWNRCPDPVLAAIERAEDRLDEARVAMWRDDRGDERREERREEREERREAREERREEREDRRDDDERPEAFARLAALQVQTASRFEGEPAVRVLVPELQLRGLQGETFYLGARFKSYQGRWSEWVTTQQWAVPQDPFVWRNAFTHFFRYSALAEEDFSEGRFVARVSVFDGQGRELAFREASFRVQLPRLPAAPPVAPAQPPVVPPPTVQRDCGTGPDVGCGLQRDGRWPMDAATFQGFLRALQGTPMEMARVQTARTMFAQHYATALQFGLVLDLFRSEPLRLQVAQAGAPRVVNPQHAHGYADKWTHPGHRASYAQLIAAQPGAGGQVVVVAPPPSPHQLPPPGPAPRDCGTGPSDPGCTMQRNGRLPMDALAYQGFLTALKSTMNDLVRVDMAESMLRNQALTALQLEPVLRLITNELTRLDLAKVAAPKVVNPEHALGFASLFRGSLTAREYVDLMSQQR